jgi:hypothetical protein
MYGIKSPAPICADPALGDGTGGGTEIADCQIVQAPSAKGTRLVTDLIDKRGVARPDGEGEIRLTYRELSALIEDAIRNLR